MKIKYIFLTLLAIFISDISFGQVTAFDGAYGAGRFATGGRNGDSYKVTSGDKSLITPGTFWYGMENAPPNGRIFVFDRGLAIDYDEETRPFVGSNEPLYRWLSDNITVLGHSAPANSGGVHFQNGSTDIRSDNFIIRYVTFAFGDYGYKDASGNIIDPTACCNEQDALSIVGSKTGIVDHVSSWWSVDENISVAGSSNLTGPKDITVQFSIISYALFAANHEESAHSMGSLINLTDTTGVVSYGYNYYAFNRYRNPRLSRTKAEIINNVYYGSEDALVSGQGCTLIVIGNSWKERNSGSFLNNYVLSETSSAGWGDNFGKVYFEDNELIGFGPGLIDPTYSEVIVANKEATGAYTSWPIVTHQQAIDTVLAKAGNRWPSLHPIDATAIASYDTGAGDIIDSQTELGGFPTIATGTPWTDTDGDNMDDALEMSYFGTLANDDMTIAPNGRTNIENLYNSRVDGAAVSASFSTSIISGNTSENGNTATFTVVLGSQPSSDVVITATSQDLTEGTVSPASRTFTTANWNTPQTFTVTGVDDGLNDGDVLYTIVVAVDDANSDDDFDLLPNQFVNVINTDNESNTIPLQSITIVDNNLTISNGNTYQLTIDFTPSDASDQTGLWESLSPSVVTVNSLTGLITAIAEGNSNIVFTANDTTNGTLRDTINVISTSSTPGRKLKSRN